jgi:hypothetical protein
MTNKISETVVLATSVMTLAEQWRKLVNPTPQPPVTGTPTPPAGTPPIQPQANLPPAPGETVIIADPTKKPPTTTSAPARKLTPQGSLMAGAGIALGTFALYQWAASGFKFDIGTILSLGSGAYGLFAGLQYFGIASGWGLAIAAAAIIIGSVLGSKKKDRDQDDAGDAAGDFNEQTFKVGVHGRVMAVSAGAFLSIAGVQFSPDMRDEIHDIPVSYVKLNQEAPNALANGDIMPTDDTRYGTVFFDANCGKGGGCLFYLTRGGTDADGKAVDRIHMLTLKEGMTVVSLMDDPSAADIPAFLTDLDGSNPRANPDAFRGLSNAGALAQLAANGNLTPEQTSRAIDQSMYATKDVDVEE